MRWQLIGTWLIGSLAGGTIALLLHTGFPDLPVKPLVMLSGAEFLTLVVLVGAVAVGLFALGWRTIGATWLRWQDPRSAVLWATLVSSVGFAGWGFAAVVTFEAGFSFTAQLILAARRSRWSRPCWRGRGGSTPWPSPSRSPRCSPVSP